MSSTYLSHLVSSLVQKGISLLLISFCFFDVRAQPKTAFEPLSIDRPDISNLPTTILPGQFQFEVGSERGHGDVLKEFHLPNLMFRTGLSKRAEFRIGYDQLVLDSVGQDRDHVIFATIGGKYRFFEEKGSRPSIALQAEFALPFGSGINYGYDHADYTLAAWLFLLLFNNTLHEQVFVNYNAGIFWSTADRLDYLVSASFSFLHTHRVGYFLELYTLILDNGIPLSFDGGLMFLVSPRFQVDVYGGQRAFVTDRLWFYGAGIGFRLDRGDLKPKPFSEIGIHH